MRCAVIGGSKSFRAGRTLLLSGLAVALTGSSLTLAPQPARAASAPALIWSAPIQVEKPPFRSRIQLNSITCPSASLCLAGDAQGTVLRSTNPASATPTWQKTFLGGEHAPVVAITCPSTSFCVAVDDGSPDFFTSTDPGSSSPHWTAATTQVFASGLACPSVNLCVGVAQQRIMTSTDPAVGASSTWHTAKFTLSSDHANLIAVSCPAVTLCVAVDTGGDILTSTNPAGGASAWTVTDADGAVAQFYVSCPSASFCVALDGLGRVEYSTNPTGGASAWQRATAPSDSGLTAFGCLSASFCIAADGSGNILTTSDPTAGAAGWTSADDDQNHAINALTCLRPTFCAVADQRGDVALSTNPTGGPAAWTVRNIDGLTLIFGLDCPTTSLCVAGDQDGNIVTSTHPARGPGGWHAASVAGPSGNIDAVSCPAASLCVAADNSGDVLTSTDPAGGASAWQVTNIAGAHSIDALTCPTTSLCVAGDQSGDIITSTDPTGGSGAWQVANVDGSNGIDSVACPSTSLCVAGDVPAGGDESNAGILTSTTPAGGAGAWQPTRFAPAMVVAGMACPSTSLCVAVGGYFFGSRFRTGAVFSSTNPTNGADWQVINVADQESDLSCPSASFCVAAGNGVLTSTSPASSNPADWPLTAGLEAVAVSCPTASLCVAADGNGDIVIGAPPAPTTTTITSVTKFPVVGQPIKIGVRVVNATRGQGNATPAGMVTVTDGTRHCTAMLSGSAGVATGSCALAEPAPGTYSLSASYPGQAPVAGSGTAGPARVKVGRATSRTTLRLSAAKIRYGHEQSEKLTVTVRPEFAGRPAGTVIIRSGGTAICTLTLRRAAASCTLRSKQLAVGTRKLTARYRGSGDFIGSTSAAKSVKVVR